MKGRQVNYELERIWKEAAVFYFKVLSRNFHGGTKENHTKKPSVIVAGLRTEIDTQNLPNTKQDC
jgi:hypothetical protein